MIKITNLTKKFDYNYVFHNFDFEFNDNGLYLLVGENGSGKSTLLYILDLLDFSYSGEVLLDNIDVKNLSKEEVNKIRRNDISMLFSRGNLLDFLSVKENREFDVTLNTKTNKFDNVADNRMSQGLSGGEELLIALSNELSKNKKIYLFDEITSDLDEINLQKVMDIIKKKSEDALVVMATHDKRILDDGKKVVITKINKIDD